MSSTLRTSLWLLVAAVLCSACELVLGDIPDKASPATASGGAGGDVATTAAGGTSSTTTSDASNGGTGGDHGSAGSFGAGGEPSGAGGTSSAGGNAGLGGSVGTAGGNAGGAGNGGTAGSGAAGASGNAGSSTGGASGMGGSGPGDASPEGAPRDAGSDADPCDVDGDGYRSRSCGGNDCDDNAILVHPGQLNYSVEPTHVGGTDFDFDCNGLPQPQFGSINCAGLGLTCDTSASAFFGTTAPECGKPGRFGHCKTSGLSCIEQLEQGSKPMPCR